MDKILFYSSIFDAEETNSLAHQVVLSVNSSGSADENLITAKDLVNEKNVKLTEVLSAQKTNPYTELLKSEDYNRDETHVGGRDVLLGMTHWVFDTPVQEAATRLVKIFERHGWSLPNYGYQKQSAATNALISELKQPENQADLTTCGMIKWFEEEIKVQAAFEELFNKKTSHDGRKESVAKRDAQVPVTDALDQLITYLNSVVSFKVNDTTWNNIYKDIEAIVKQAVTVSRSRRSTRTVKTDEK